MRTNYDKLIKKSNNPEKMKTIAEQLQSFDFYANSFVGKELSSLPDLLSDDEKLLYAATGIYDGHSVLVVLTNTRLLLVNKNMVVGSSNSAISLDKINEVSYRNSILYGKVSFTNGATTNTIDNVEKKVTPKLTDAIRNAINVFNEKPNASSNNDSGITAEKLKEIKQLAEDGIVSKDEFEAAKREYLGL